MQLTINGIHKLKGNRVGLLVFPSLRIYDVEEVVGNASSYMLVLEGEVTINIHRQLLMGEWVRMELVPTFGIHKPIGYGEMEYEKMLSMDRFIEGLKGVEWKP